MQGVVALDGHKLAGLPFMERTLFSYTSLVESLDYMLRKKVLVSFFFFFLFFLVFIASVALGCY